MGGEVLAFALRDFGSPWHGRVESPQDAHECPHDHVRRRDAVACAVRAQRFAERAGELPAGWTRWDAL